jgi:hypothetical protein
MKKIRVLKTYNVENKNLWTDIVIENSQTVYCIHSNNDDFDVPESTSIASYIYKFKNYYVFYLIYEIKPFRQVWKITVSKKKNN